MWLRSGGRIEKAVVDTIKAKGPRSDFATTATKIQTGQVHHARPPDNAATWNFTRRSDNTLTTCVYNDTCASGTLRVGSEIYNTNALSSECPPAGSLAISKRGIDRVSALSARE